VLSEAAVISLTLGKLLYLDGAAEDLCVLAPNLAAWRSSTTRVDR